MNRYTTAFGIWVVGQTLPDIADMCEVCGIKPKFVENGVKHKYCSRTCARSGPGHGPVSCKLDGCRATGRSAWAQFCTEAHAKEGVRQGLVRGCDRCNLLPRTIGECCIPCDRRSRNTPASAPGIRELKVDGRTFKSHRDQFLKAWDSSEPAPKVEKIYEVEVSGDDRTKHKHHRSRLPSATEIRTYHSSQCICNFGTTSDASLCSFKSCGICCAVKSSFNSFAFGEQYNSGRFGDGVYTYQNPSLADGFATSCTTSPYRVSIGCSAIVPSGAPGSIKGDRESVFVQTADAILPVCIVVYRKT